MKSARERSFVHVQKHNRTKGLVLLSPPRARKTAKPNRVKVVLSPDFEAELAKVHSWTTNSNISDFVKAQSTSSTGYRRSPLRLNVKASKSSTFYNAHSYPTKVPPEVIEPYIIHYTKEDDIVLDAFCGSGMTGVAALRNQRRVILRDLSPVPRTSLTIIAHE